MRRSNNMNYIDKPIRDDEIRIIRADNYLKEESSNKKRFSWKWLLLILAILLVGGILWKVLTPKPEPSIEEIVEPSYYDPAPLIQEPVEVKEPLSRAAEIGYGFIEITDTIINDIPIRIFIPHHVKMTLQVGAIDSTDNTILFAAMAADVRADNGGIVGSYVLEGKPMAESLSKKGFCAIINDTATVGVAENSPLFEKATKTNGYFFRQFPLVDNGRLVENVRKGKAIRRGLCDRNGELFTVETLTRESLHDFAQALVDLGVDQAITLVGSTAYGWAVDADGQRHVFGNHDPSKKKWENVNYLVMRNKD